MIGRLGNRFGKLGASPGSLPLPVQLGSVLYLSKTYGTFDKSVSGGDTFVNEWRDPYSGKKAIQTTGDYRPKLKPGGVEFDGINDYMSVADESDIEIDSGFTISA